MKQNTSYHSQSRQRTAIAAIVLLLIALPAAPGASPATSGTSRPAQTTASATETDVIEREVYATRDQAGKFVIERETISMTPSTTGAIEEVLRARSVAQFDLNSRSSELGGEITPPRFSIRGDNYYDNNFMINGVSNNNYLGQGGFLDAGGGATSSPGGEAQAIFVNPDLIGSVVIYTDNVPVEYGGFTGGVFDAKYRDPRHDGFHASLGFSNYTRDSWTSQKFTEGNDPERTTNTNNHQPLFERYSFFMTAESPLTKNIAGLLSYSESRSTVPVWDSYTPSTKFKNISVNRNLLARLSTHGIDGFHAALTTIYAPFEREQRTASRRDSLFTSEGGGYSAMLEVEKKLPFGKLSGDVSYRNNDTSRDTATNKQFSWANSATNAYANWGGSSSTAAEGNSGDFEQHQKTFAANAKLALVEFGPKYLRNNITAGIQFSAAHMQRETEGSSSFSWTAANSPSGANRMDPASTGDKENGVITGEQWLNYLVFYGASNKTVSQTEIAAYVEDKIKVERFTATAGIRVDHESFIGTTAWSPRLALNADVLNNGKLNIFAGAARYAQSTVTSFKYALFNNQTQERLKRANYDEEWVNRGDDYHTLPYNTGNLKAPHADAFNLGASTVWNGYVFRLDGSIRRHRDIIRTKPGSSAVGYTRAYTNSGKSDYSGVTFEIEKKTRDLGWAGQHNLLLSLTHSKTESNSRGDYVMEENVEGGNWSHLYAFYNGELVPADNLPATNFSTPLVVTFSDMASFWGGRVRLYNTLRFEKGGDGLAQSSKDPSKPSDDPDYNKYYILNDALDPSQGGVYQTAIPSLGRGVYYYTNRRYDNILFWDMSLDYDAVKTRAGTLTLQLRVTNILNRHDHVNTTLSATGGIYTAGRQLYAGIQYKF